MTASVPVWGLGAASHSSYITDREIEATWEGKALVFLPGQKKGISIFFQPITI